MSLGDPEMITSLGTEAIETGTTDVVAFPPHLPTLTATFLGNRKPQPRPSL